MLMFLFKSKSMKSVVFNLTEGSYFFCGVLFCGFFILRELMFVDRGQSGKSAKIRMRKIFI